MNGNGDDMSCEELLAELELEVHAAHGASFLADLQAKVLTDRMSCPEAVALLRSADVLAALPAPRTRPMTDEEWAEWSAPQMRPLNDAAFAKYLEEFPDRADLPRPEFYAFDFADLPRPRVLVVDDDEGETS